MAQILHKDYSVGKGLRGMRHVIAYIVSIAYTSSIGRIVLEPPPLL